MRIELLDVLLQFVRQHVHGHQRFAGKLLDNAPGFRIELLEIDVYGGGSVPGLADLRAR